MHMKDDHMRNVQLKPGYNVQIGVDSEYIVSTDIFQGKYKDREKRKTGSDWQEIDFYQFS